MTHLMKFSEEKSFSRLLEVEDLKELCLKDDVATIFVDPLQTSRILMYDESNKIYSMLFSHFITATGEWCSISGEWHAYLSQHNLNAGDKLSFYKNGRGDFLIKYEKKSCPVVHAALNVNVNVNKTGVPETEKDLDFCLSKVLKSGEVNHPNAILFFKPQDVVSLRRGFSENNSEDLIVFDTDGRHYIMCFSKNISVGSEMKYALRTGWSTFVTTQALKEGDVLAIYRFGKNGYLFRHEGSENSGESLESCTWAGYDHDDQFCFKKVLDFEDVRKRMPVLGIFNQSTVLFEDEDEGKLHEVFVIDEEGRLFSFQMVQCADGPQLKSYNFNGQWYEFIDRQKLKVGDLVIFWKVENKSLSLGFYFHVKMVKKERIL